MSTDTSSMLYIGGNHSGYHCQCGNDTKHRSFRCENVIDGASCGANVFTKTGEHGWRCNACAAEYTDL